MVRGVLTRRCWLVTMGGMQDFRSRRVTVAGLGRFGGGVSVARWLVQQGAQVTVTDQASADVLGESVKKLDSLPIRFVLGEHRDTDFTDTEVVVASPAIAPDNRYLQLAHQADVPVTTEICLFVERCTAPIVGVTGTKGKSTTTAMLGAILSKSRRTWVGGNIGRSLLGDLPQISPSDAVVLELSSYMLDYLRVARWSPHVAVITMIAPDHLQWHGSYEKYVRAKQTIVEFQQAGDFALANSASESAIAMARRSGGTFIAYGAHGYEPFELHVPGEHNQLNAQGAFTAAKLLGATRPQAVEALSEFRGLSHRLELVHEADGVRWFDDSIATIPQAAVVALHAFESRRVIQIVGGYDKHLAFDALAAALNRHARAVLCIGATGPTIARLMEKDDVADKPAVYECGDLATAVRRARSIAEAGDVVLLSTACASYDQFVNFEKRGERFAELARRG